MNLRLWPMLYLSWYYRVLKKSSLSDEFIYGRIRADIVILPILYFITLINILRYFKILSVISSFYWIAVPLAVITYFIGDFRSHNEVFWTKIVSRASKKFSFNQKMYCVVFLIFSYGAFLMSFILVNRSN